MEKWKNKNKFHGVTSVLLLYAALALGCAVVFRHSIAFGSAYAALILLWPLPVAWFFCAKCPCRLDCGHVAIGAITRILPERKPGKYSVGDVIGSILPILVVVAFPQYWLWRDTAASIVFWALTALAGIEARFGVCVSCPNEYCPLNRG
jgi:hypothetical protein